MGSRRILFWEETHNYFFQQAKICNYLSNKRKSHVLKKLSQQDKADADHNPNANNKEELITRLTDDIMISSFLKHPSKDSKESKNTKLSYYMEK